MHYICKLQKGETNKKESLSEEESQNGFGVMYIYIYTHT